MPLVHISILYLFIYYKNNIYGLRQNKVLWVLFASRLKSGNYGVKKPLMTTPLRVVLYRQYRMSTKGIGWASHCYLSAGLNRVTAIRASGR